MLRGLSEIVTYITDEMVRKEFERVLDEIRANGLTIEPWKGGKDRWLVAKYKTEGVASIQPCRSYFNYVLCDDEGTEVWPPVKLRTYLDWEQKARPDFLKWLAAAKNEAEPGTGADAQ